MKSNNALALLGISMIQETIKLRALSSLFLLAMSFLIFAKPLLAATMEQGTVTPLFPVQIQEVDFSSEASAWQYPGHEHEMFCCESEEPRSLAPAVSQQNKLKDSLKVDSVPFLLASSVTSDVSSSSLPSPGSPGIFLFFQKE